MDKEKDIILLFEQASEKLEKSKMVLNKYEKIHPDDIDNILKLNSCILKIEQQRNDINTRITKLRIDKYGYDWDKIQILYEDYCKTFSPSYLAGCEWYQFISKNDSNFKKAYYQSNLEENCSKYKEICSEVFSFIFMNIV